MLLRNESRVQHSIHIRLIFDDNKKRELDITEGDLVQVSYRKNHRINCGVGIIRDIKTYAPARRKENFCMRESAIITLDMSEDHVCCVDKFDMFDIIDIRIVKQCPCNPDPTPDFDVKGTDTTSIVGCPITSKGVTIYD